MKPFQMFTQCRKLDSPDWSAIKLCIMDLPYSRDAFLVLSRLDKEHCFIQTVINTKEHRTQGLYSLELRVPVGDDFRHYQLNTNDSVKIVNDFSQFYQGHSPDISLYTDITTDFKA